MNQQTRAIFFIDFIEEYNHQLLVVNVKEAGIEKNILDILKNKGIDNFFLLDIEFPFCFKTTVNLVRIYL